MWTNRLIIHCPLVAELELVNFVQKLGVDAISRPVTQNSTPKKWKQMKMTACEVNLSRPLGVSGPNLVVLGALVLHCVPGLSVITVSQFEGRDKLDGAEILGSLCDDSGELFGRLQVHLSTPKFQNGQQEVGKVI